MILSILREFLDIRHHIKARIFLCLVSVSLLSFLIFSLFWYKTTLRNAYDTIADGNASSLANVSQLIDNIIDSAAIHHVAMLNDDTVQRYIQQGNEGAPGRGWFELYNYTLTFIKRYVTSKNNCVSGIRLYLPDGSQCAFGSITAGISGHLTMPFNQDMLFFENDALYLARRARISETGSATLITEFTTNLFSQMFSGLTDGGANLYVFLNQTQLVRALDDADSALPVSVLAASGPATEFMQDHLICRTDASPRHLAYVYTVPMLKLSGSVGATIYQLATPAAIVFIVVLSISTLLSASVTRGMVTLNRNISRAAQGDFASLEIIPSTDEVGLLGQSFVEMTQKIDELINEINRRESERHDLQMQVLRAQVSPHFLCNTLNSITYLAAMQNVENIRQLSVSLNELLQSALYIDDSLVPLQEELDYIRHYFNIMEYRQAQSIELAIRVDPAFYPLKVMRMALQPIVENALIHGLATCPQYGRVDITATREGEKLILTVTDNGVGMTPDQIRRSFEQPRNTSRQRFNGIGLPNVQKRIQMQFGVEYGLAIRSEVGAYTAIEIHMPYIERGMEP